MGALLYILTLRTRHHYLEWINRWELNGPEYPDWFFFSLLLGDGVCLGQGYWKEEDEQELDGRGLGGAELLLVILSA
jgi:hypothetical protein